MRSVIYLVMLSEVLKMTLKKAKKKRKKMRVKNYCTDLKGQIDECHTTIALMLNHISPCQNILKCSLSVTF